MAISSYLFSKAHLTEQVKYKNKTLNIFTAGQWVKDNSNNCEQGDNFWFLSIFYWNLAKLYLYLDDKNSHKAQIAEDIKNNWAYVSTKVISPPTYLAPDNWVNPADKTLCPKTQVSLYWLALANQVVSSKTPANNDLLIGQFPHSPSPTPPRRALSPAQIIAIAVGALAIVGLLGFLILRYRKTRSKA